ncbi:1-acyl-sn-glycerol-3-phosphate acyltransferase [Caldicoprobacter algeriensis]|uniref:lysophospholipid acyltransferase family protein n=1 Tax=Caldicoprobacter algeriensis TaxID=699281 RepID=UPI00207AEB51|nr:lysophospholipid acyltransferase family protein [Caldicoprobacter algeriensis]MCM8900845.1 1-acyl-sn-glycerol-3-phosphate acyltransferase [Caldicoprobacter algeriensis]
MFYKLARAIVRPIMFLLFRLRVEGIENFPMEGKTIVYSNHISLLDPILIGCVLPRQVFFMAKVELFKIPLLRTIIRHLGAFPVKRGSADLSAIKHSLQVLNEGKVFGIFPEGTRSKTGFLQSFSHGIASIAHKSRAKILPIAIVGQYRLFRPITVKIGKPLNFDDYFDQKSNTELLEKMADEMEQALKSLLSA